MNWRNDSVLEPLKIARAYQWFNNLTSVFRIGLVGLGFMAFLSLLFLASPEVDRAATFELLRVSGVLAGVFAGLTALFFAVARYAGEALPVIHLLVVSDRGEREGRFWAMWVEKGSYRRLTKNEYKKLSNNYPRLDTKYASISNVHADEWQRSETTRSIQLGLAQVSITIDHTFETDWSKFGDDNDQIDFVFNVSLAEGYETWLERAVVVAMTQCVRRLWDENEDHSFDSPIWLTDNLGEKIRTEINEELTRERFPSRVRKLEVKSFCAKSAATLPGVKSKTQAKSATSRRKTAAS